MKKINTKHHDTIAIYYKKYEMNGNFKKKERIIKEIVSKHVKSTDENKKLKIIIYYKNLKTAYLVIKLLIHVHSTPIPLHVMFNIVRVNTLIEIREETSGLQLQYQNSLSTSQQYNIKKNLKRNTISLT